MRKILLLMVFISFTAPSFAQQTEPTKPMTKKDYLDKSKRQKTTAWVLLGSGAALVGTGLLIGNREESSFDEAGTGVIIGALGAISAIISIPVFIASGRNNKKAAEATTYLEFRREDFAVPIAFRLRSFPAIAINFQF